MAGSDKRRMRFAMFTTVTPGGSPPSLWYHPQAIGFDYLSLADWTRLATALEAAKFDCIFWADHTGVHDTYQQSYAPAVELAMQFPIADPVILAAALAPVTENLGFAFSANVIQSHPYIYARALSTLDHLSGGRIGWNIVTSFQPTAWRNLGYDEVEPHARRYQRGDEYMEVIYKLLEGSWEDDAVVRDVAARVYAHPAKVHEIHHDGELYRVPGIHTLEPSPQRVPVLFQAGSSEQGREFAARNAEAIFVVGNTAADMAKSLRTFVADMDRRVEANGRRRGDLHYFAGRCYILGSTEEEARRLDAETQEMLGESDYQVAYMSSLVGVDLGTIDLDKPIGDFETEAIQGTIRMLSESTTDRSSTFRDIAMRMTGNRFVGTPEQAADEIEQWLDLGITGINYLQMTGTEEVYRFIDQVCPILKKRGIMQEEYAPGTFREKLFAGTGSSGGPRLNDRHPAASYRRSRAVSW